jgi:hypothetical protein
MSFCSAELSEQTVVIKAPVSLVTEHVHEGADFGINMCFKSRDFTGNKISQLH